MSSSSDSDTSTGSSPYVSDNEVKYCKSTCQSIDNYPCTDDIPGFVAVALDETERTEIATIREQEMKASGDRFYPKKLKAYIQDHECKIYQQIMNEVTDQKGWVFAAPSILQMISQRGHQKPGGVKFDVCHCSPGKPLKVLTITSEDDSENRYVRYNARLTSMIVSHIEEDIGQSLSAVYGVIDGRKHVSDEEFRKKIRVLEITAQKTSLPQTLHVDGHKYRKMTESLLDLFSTTIPCPQITDNISPGTYMQKKMTGSFTDGEKHHGTDNDDNRAFTNKEESYAALPVPAMKHKTRDWGPQREQLWTDDELEKHQQVIYKSRKDSKGNEISLRILAFGPTGHGKSSLCNGFRSAIKGYTSPSTYHAAGIHDSSVTQGFQGACYGKHWIIDMAGIYESKKISSLNIENIVSGRVPFFAELTDDLEVRDMDLKITLAPGENDVSCVVIVLRYDTQLGPELRRQIEVIRTLGKQGVISYRLVLTCLDECDPQFNDTDNLPLMYKSAKVQSAVERMSVETGIPRNVISFIKNYTKETETDNNTSLQHLRVLKNVLNSAVEQEEKKRDQSRQRELYHKAKPPKESMTQVSMDHSMIFRIALVVLAVAIVLALFGKAFVN